MSLPYTCFRPQYIYGPKQGKSYLAGFFDRAAAGRPVLVPGDGSQMVTFTHAADNAAMIAAAVGKESAVGQARRITARRCIGIVRVELTVLIVTHA